MSISLPELIDQLMALARQGRKILLIDADRIPYLAALRADSADVGPEDVLGVVRGSLSEFERNTDTDLELAHLSISERPVFIYLISTRSFRHQICSEYKANRAKSWTPPLRKACVEAMFTFRPHTCFSFDGYEADDLVGILATYLPESIIVSNDKDLLQVPGEHYNPQKRECITITPEQARYHVYEQWIRGDSSDGYGGIYGMGQVKTAKFLESIEWWDRPEWETATKIYSLYEKHKCADKFWVTGILSRILRDVLGSTSLPRWDQVKTPGDEAVP